MCLCASPGKSGGSLMMLRDSYRDVMLENFTLLASLGGWCGLEDKEVSSEQRVSLEGVPQIRSSVADLKTYLCDTCGPILKDILCLAGYQGERARHKPYYCGACGRQFWFNTPIRQCWKQPSGQKFFRREEGRDSAKTCRGHVLEKNYTHGEGGMGFLITFGFPQHQAPPSRMQVHENTELGEDFHSGQRHHECSECGKVFTHRNTLAWHQRVHAGEKPYECCECGKFFRQRYGLFKHQTVHTGEKLYQCSKCGKFFSSKSNLTRHQEFHTGARPYECSECGKAFTQRPNLIRHWKVHAGERPYKCSEYGKEFMRKQALVLHWRIHTAEKL